jgi:uncharacterized protein YkwD
VIHALLCFLCSTATGVTPPASAAHRPTAPQSYERWVSPEPLSRDERVLFRLVRAWGQERGAAVRYDARLVRAARQLLSEVPSRPGEALDLEHARRLAQSFGWIDGQLAAIGLHVPAGEDPTAALRAQLRRAIGDVEVNRVGVAVKAAATDTVVLVLLSRRLIDLEPLPSRVHRGTTLRLAGRMRSAEPIKGASLALELPGGATQRRPIVLTGRSFIIQVKAGDRAGVMRVELLVDRGRGPEIAAILPVGVETDPTTDDPPITALESTTDLIPDDELESMLVALILGSRNAAGAPLLATSAGLSDAARSHAADMRGAGFFAHVSPTTGDLTDRLKERGVRYVRALEDIAIGDSADAVWQQWMTSPAHRANLLEPGVTTLGVGLVSKPSPGGGAKLFAVAILAKLADDGDNSDLAREAVTQLNRERVRRGLPRLTVDPSLARLALRHSQELARLDRVDDSTPGRGALVDTVFEELEVSEAAADVYLADSVAVVTKSSHVREGFSRVGVAVYRDVRRPGPQLYVTVIYASD